MSDADLERQIFEGSSQPEPDLAPGQVDEAVSRSIREMGRGPDDQPPGQQPAQPRTPAAPDPLAGLDDRSNSGLLRALLDERERRQGLSQRLERYEAQARQQAAQEGRPALNERLFADPEATLNELRREWTGPLEQQIAQLQLNHDFGLAQVRHGAEWQAAWEMWYGAVKDGQDAQSYFHVMNAPSPGEAMVQWYKQRRDLTEIGEGGLAAYRERLLAEFRAGNTGEQPRTANGQYAARPQAPQPAAAALPTSLSRMGSGAPAADDDDANDGSDAAIFAAARPRRGRNRDR